MLLIHNYPTNAIPILCTKYPTKIFWHRHPNIQGYKCKLLLCYSQRYPKIYGNKYDKKVSIPKSFSKVGFTDTVILFPLIFIRKFNAYYLNNKKKTKKLYVENSFKMANRTTISWVCIFLTDLTEK